MNDSILTELLCLREWINEIEKEYKNDKNSKKIKYMIEELKIQLRYVNLTIDNK